LTPHNDSEVSPYEAADLLLDGFAWAELLPALAGAPVATLVFVGPELLVAFQSQEAVRMLGRRPAGSPAREALADLADYVTVVGRCMASGDPIALERSPVTLPDPDDDHPAGVLLDAYFYPLRGRDGSVQAVLAQAVDVTTRYADDERLRLALALNRIGLDLSRSLEVEQVTATVTRLAANFFSGWGLLDLWQSNGALARVAVTHHDPALQPTLEKLKRLPRVSGRAHGEPEPYSTRTARTGQSFMVDLSPSGLVEVGTNEEHRDVLRKLRPRWFITVPVQVGPRRLGALSVVRPDGERPFAPADRFVLEQFAERAAIALAHAHDYGEQRQSALALQRSLLPPVPTSTAHVQLAARYQSGGAGAEVGGDWYDTIPLQGGSLGVVVGDVEGHDLNAAGLMGQVRAVVHSHAHLGLPPGRIAEEANAFVLSTSSEQLVTMTYMQLYPQERLLVWVRAGHMPAIAVAPGGDVTLMHGRGGLPLGVEATASWGEDTMHLPSGTLLAVFTDGLVETTEQSFDEGVAALAALLAAHRTEDVEVLADLALATLREEAGHRDDVALVLVRLPAAEAPAVRSISRRLPAAASSAPIARLFLRDLLTQWQLPEATVDTAALLATELVSNATRHSDTGVELRVKMAADRLRVAVFDESHRMPHTVSGDAEATGGRGLQLVERLASSWGVQTEDGGKAVWFELAADATSGH
jgi:serine phosphatase RsbU (regulator of sigma subunit)/anti-sigma regulatory factor (Ser/Thr protein kinase)